MTADRRIFLNVVATYGRSLLAMFCGVFTSRWALLSLGESDYGLFGVVGGLAVFVSFLNNLFGASAARYFAYYIGHDAQGGDSSREECRQWFSVAVLIHAVLSVALIVIGYPIGVLAIRGFLTIPVDRVDSCITVFRWVSLSCFVGMVSVPFSAMYTAKQYIAELTAYSVLSILVNISALYWMVTHVGDWLVFYAVITCICGVLPNVLIMLRARIVISECRFCLASSLDWTKIRELIKFTGWNFFGGLGYLLRGQGIAILVNKYFGPSVNASMTISNTVNAQAANLSQAMTGAFMPAITTACGKGDLVEMRKLTFRACKFGMILVLIFMIPLALELQYVLELWLKTPPPYLHGLCLCMMVLLLSEKSTIGHGTAIHAMGKISLYQTCFGSALLMTLPLAWICVVIFDSPYAVVVGMTGAMIMASLVRVVLARRFVGLSIRHWTWRIIVPVLGATTISVAVGLLVQVLMPSSLMRVVVAAVSTNAVFVPLVVLMLDVEERAYVRGMFRKVLRCIPWVS